MNKKNQALTFDFDQWAIIAKDDPEEFEAMRRALINQMLEQTPDNIKRRLKGLQWRIDQERERSANPMASCLQISKMMWNSVLGDQGLLTALETPDKILKKEGPSEIDNVIPLKKTEK